MNTNPSKQRQQFYRDYASGQWSMSELCDRYQISDDGTKDLPMGMESITGYNIINAENLEEQNSLLRATRTLRASESTKSCRSDPPSLRAHEDRHAPVHVFVKTAVLCAASLLTAVACTHSAPSDPCDPMDPVLADSSFVAVVMPTAGLRTSTPLNVRGCSRTFESNVVWELRARDGRVLASGHTTGGGVSAAAVFAFSIPFAVSAPEVGHLMVFELDASDGEGFPAGRTTVPLVLLPSPE